MPIIVVLPLIRKKCGLTQEDLARLSDRSPQLIGKLEQGRARGIGFDTLSRICEITSSQINEIFVYVPDDPMLLDEIIVSLSKRFSCSIEEVLSCIPKDIRRNYQRQRWI